MNHDIRVGNVGLGGSTSIGAGAGPFLFFGSQTPLDLETGRLVRGFNDLPAAARTQLASGILLVDIPAERALAQTWRLLQNLKDILSLQGSSLDSIVRMRIFLADMRDRAAVEQVILQFMPDERPATTIVCATNAGADDEIAVQVDAIALAAESRLRRESISVAALDRLAAPFPLASKAGQFVFTTPLPGVNPETGQPVNRLAELVPEDRELAPRPADARQEALMAQDLTIYSHLRRVLEAQGGSLESIIHHNTWLRIPMRQFGTLARVRSNLFSRRRVVAAATSFPMAGVRREEALFEWEVQALLPPRSPSDFRKEVHLEPHGLTRYNAPAVKAGPFLFTAGEVPIDTTIPRLLDSFADLPPPVRLFPYGRVHKVPPIMAQTWYIYHLLSSYLQAYRTSLAKVVHQTVYIVNPAAYPAVERIATLFYGAKLPPTTLVPILGASPYPNAEIEIEVIATTPPDYQAAARS
ncbi:MAG: Rid family hydrolase [Dehalococcoidia bacterium]